jgi:hypothetical protein
MEPFRLFSLSVGQTRLTMEMEDHVVDDFPGAFSEEDAKGGGVVQGMKAEGGGKRFGRQKQVRD